MQWNWGGGGVNVITSGTSTGVKDNLEYGKKVKMNYLIIINDE
jgi:hypothetical protein